MKKAIVWSVCAVALLFICLTRWTLGELIDSYLFHSSNQVEVIIKGVAIGGVVICVIVSFICFHKPVEVAVIIVTIPFVIGMILTYVTIGILEFNNIRGVYLDYDLFSFMIPWILVSYFLMAAVSPVLFDGQDTESDEDEDDECATVKDLKKLATKNSLKGYVKRSELEAEINKIKDEYFQVGEDKKV